MILTLLKLEINRHIEKINTVVIDLNSIDMFLGYDWLIKHNPEDNWNKGTIQFTRCSKRYKIQYQYYILTNCICHLFQIISISSTLTYSLLKQIILYSNHLLLYGQKSLYSIKNSIKF